VFSKASLIPFTSSLNTPDKASALSSSVILTSLGVPDRISLPFTG